MSVIDIELIIDQRSDIKSANIFERLVQPEQVISFLVAWQNASNEIDFNRGYPVQFDGAIGPDIDVPAGDINLGAGEFGFLFGTYRRITIAFRAYRPAKVSLSVEVKCGSKISQDRMRRPSDADQIDDALQGIMSDIHAACVENGTREGSVKGANIAGFKKVADAMLLQGLG